MTNLTRRYFLGAAATLPLGCALRHTGTENAPANAETVREPAAGQSWRYSKHDVLSGAFLDTQVDRVETIGDTVSIDSRSETGVNDKHGHSAWGLAWLRKNLGSHKPNVSDSSEIQRPWGKILVDPHWSEIQVFETPIPLWPAELRPGWHTHFDTEYKTPSHDGDGLPWDQTITAHAWETITVPAGQFSALRFSNQINFTSTDFGRAACKRQETIWLAPQVGRWVKRESIGTYYLSESVDDTQAYEPSFRLELLEWT